MGTPEYLVFAIFILTGFMSLAAAVFNFKWFFQSSNTSAVVGRLGRKGARIFYGLLGIALITAGILFSFFGYGA
jgi:hypothetical protein